MCATCGCDHDAEVSIMRPGAPAFQQVQASNMIHPATRNRQREIELERDILGKNNSMARHNHHHFAARHILAINLVSSPGSGKTSLLERTLTDLKASHQFYVIEGDQQTMNDANRIAATGVTAIQINTGKGCHLDADMIHRALHELDPASHSILFIENVGNLVCPAMFDLGEEARVAIISVTEGDDKPLKYPDMFASSQLCIINKVDLLPYVNFSVEAAKANALRVNPRLEFIEVSATKGDGMSAWYNWLSSRESALNESPRELLQEPIE
ncbi:MAG: hydrogenase nickel incorporation protein HypB [Cyclobacteriaceae bacterium]